MTIAECEQQILRIKKASFQAELDEALAKYLRQQVVSTVQTVLEASLIEEVNTDLAILNPRPRRSGYFQRTLDTQYGRIERLSVPKIRHSNKVRSWRIVLLTRLLSRYKSVWKLNNKKPFVKHHLS